MPHHHTQPCAADVVRIDYQRHSVWLRNGVRLGFAAARRLGLDPEGLTGPYGGLAVTIT